MSGDGHTPPFGRSITRELESIWSTVELLRFSVSVTTPQIPLILPCAWGSTGLPEDLF